MTNPTTTDTSTSTDTSTDASTASSGEHDDLVEALRRHRGFLLHTVAGLSDEQARTRSTASELTLGGLVKHVAATESDWADFMVAGPADRPAIDWDAVDWSDPPAFVQEFRDGHRMLEDETLDALVARFEEVAARTDAIIAGADLDRRWPLPQAPWFEAGATWSLRRTALHLIGEISQHAGHADIIRESIDGQKTMG